MDWIRKYANNRARQSGTLMAVDIEEAQKECGVVMYQMNLSGQEDYQETKISH